MPQPAFFAGCINANLCPQANFLVIQVRRVKHCIAISKSTFEIVKQMARADSIYCKEFPGFPPARE